MTDEQIMAVVRLYKTWGGMRYRCTPGNVSSKHWGDRGIIICDRWSEFLPFYIWAVGTGYSLGLSIDRIDNEGSYSPENCHWATKTQQARNQRRTKLTLETVAQIRSCIANTDLTNRELGKIYGVSRQNIQAIKTERSWKPVSTFKKPKIILQIPDEQVKCIVRLERIWKGIHSRCNFGRVHAKNYGDRGITVSDEWDEFLPFYKWSVDSGYSTTLTIDRVNNDGDYSPKNCRWANSEQQNRNKRSTRLTVMSAGEIKWYILNTDLNDQQIGDIYGVSSAVVNPIRLIKNWKSVEAIKPQKELQNATLYS